MSLGRGFSGNLLAGRCVPGKDIINELGRGIMNYKSDYLDGTADNRGVQKTFTVL